VSSKKFSRQAKHWDILKEKAYGKFYGFKAFECLLRGKEFIIQTDHDNLAWIGANQTPIVARWRIYMQGFNYQVQLIPGTKIGLANYLSQMYQVNPAV
jgi:hypothetical protein